MNRTAIRVLLIEDDPEDIELLQRYLRDDARHEYAIGTAERLEEGLARLDSFKADVLLLDISLPDSHGISTFHKAFSRAPDVPIVLLTGMEDEKLALEAVKSGAQDYLNKREVSSRVISRAISYAIWRKKAEDLLKREALHREFIANASHELRTPIAAIKASAETLGRSLTAPNPDRELVRIIESQAERLRGLVEYLLDLSMLESGQRPALPESISLQAFLPEFVAGFGLLAKKKKVKIDWKAPPGFKVWIDRSHLDRILQNLVDNAIKFSPAGGEIHIEGKPSGEVGLISVRDSGVGMPKDQIPLLFQEFADKAARRTKGRGTGLGLLLVKGLLGANGGRIEAASSPGKGMTFTFTVPLGR